MSANLSTTMSFSDEQALLLDTATGFFRDKSSSAAVRSQLTSETGFDAAVWREMVALGWSGIAIPEEYGGSGLGFAAAVPIAEPMGRHLFASPWLATQLFVSGVLAGGSGKQQSRYLSAVAEGAVGTVALCERDGNWDLMRVVAPFAEEQDEVLLSGVKTFVNDAGCADFLLVSGSLDGAPCLAFVGAAQVNESSRQRETVIDETRRSYSVCLDGISVPADAVIRGAAAASAFEQIRNTALLLISAESAGGIAGILDVVVEYLNTRSAFGRKIGGYQGLKHPTVDILVGLERVRSHVYHAASLLEAGEKAEVALRMAKAEAADVFAFASDRAIQFHGGFGFSYECDAQLYLRRALWSQYAFGDAPHHRKRLAGLLLS